MEAGHDHTPDRVRLSSGDGETESGESPLPRVSLPDDPGMRDYPFREGQSFDSGAEATAAADENDVRGKRGRSTSHAPAFLFAEK